MSRVLGTTALSGRELLQLFQVDLGAFGVVGGIVVAWMGFEMRYGGTSSRTQGTVDVEAETEAEHAEDGAALEVALIGVAIVSVLVVVGFAVFGDWSARPSDITTAMLARIGRLLQTTIGMQLALDGIRTSYEF